MFVSNERELPQITVNGRMPGEELALPSGSEVTIKTTVTSAPLERVDAIRNGEVLQSFPLKGARHFGLSFNTPGVSASGWYSVRAIGAPRAAHPGWRSEKEKAHVLGQFAEARAIYEERAK